MQNADGVDEPVHGEENPEAGRAQAVHVNPGVQYGTEVAAGCGNSRDQIDWCYLFCGGLVWSCLNPYR
jgi:hypothetical protein